MQIELNLCRTASTEVVVGYTQNPAVSNILIFV